MHGWYELIPVKMCFALTHRASRNISWKCDLGPLASQNPVSPLGSSAFGTGDFLNGCCRNPARVCLLHYLCNDKLFTQHYCGYMSHSLNVSLNLHQEANSWAKHPSFNTDGSHTGGSVYSGPTVWRLHSISAPRRVRGWTIFHLQSSIVFIFNRTICW